MPALNPVIWFLVVFACVVLTLIILHAAGVTL